jgi:hypothetical protein
VIQSSTASGKFSFVKATGLAKEEQCANVQYNSRKRVRNVQALRVVCNRNLWLTCSQQIGAETHTNRIADVARTSFSRTKKRRYEEEEDVELEQTRRNTVHHHRTKGGVDHNSSEDGSN